MTEEVRRCRSCGEVAVLSETEWQHTVNGMSQPNVVTRELRCQACGHQTVLRARAKLWGAIIAGVLLLCTPMGIPLLIWSYWAWMQDDWNPVVAGAPPVARRFRVGPLPRRCAACEGECVCTAVTRNTTNGIPTGTEWTFTCRSCGQDFTIESLWAHIFSLFALSVVAAIGVAFLTLAEGAGWRWGGSGVCALVVALLAGQWVLRLVARVRNPEMV